MESLITIISVLIGVNNQLTLKREKKLYEKILKLEETLNFTLHDEWARVKTELERSEEEIWKLKNKIKKMGGE